jgi:hypothetical protein
MATNLHRVLFAAFLLALAVPALAQTTVTLRDGLNGYAGTRDNDGAVAYADANRGTSKHYDLNWNTGAAFVKFAIFAAEGGPVPDGATITSATLSVYQYFGPGSTWEARRLLKDWQEMQSTWNSAATGSPWQTAGALGSTDIAATADGQTSLSSLGWLNLNVTAGVQAFASGTPNYGWRLGWLSGTTGAKTFHSREGTTDPALRPTLTVSYTTGPSPSCGSGSLRPYDGSPINGNPISISASGHTFEAEHFNCGGEGVAYHDSTASSNAGQTFRANESVDIIGAPSGLAVNNFEATEWLIYTINVQTAGTYDLGILASAAATGGSNRAFRIEIDGTDVSGPVAVPDTADWNTYQWAVKTGVALTAGPHELKLVSETQYFRVDRIQIVPAGSGGGGGGGGGTGIDDCPDGLPLCVTFDQASTTYPATDQIRAEGVDWWANNKLGSVTEIDPTKRRVWLQTQQVRHGTHAVQMMAREDDTCVASGSPCDPNTNNERSEVHLYPAGPTPTGAQHGVTQWWAHSVYFPQEFLIRADDGGSGEKTAIFAQFHHAGTLPAIAMEVYGQVAPNAADRRKVFRVWSWGPKPGTTSSESDHQYRYTAPGASSSRPGACFEHDVEEGVWYDFIHKIVWANNGSGEHHIWMRKAGAQTVAKVLAKTGLSLVYPDAWDRNHNGVINSEDAPHWSKPERIYAYLKIGVYQTQIRPGQQGERLRKDASGNYLAPLPGSEYVSSVIHDRIRRGGTYESVRMPDFPATLPTTGVTCNNQPLS